MTTNNTGEKDINDVFDDILFAEEIIIEKAYDEGYKEGVTQGNPEGYHLGYHRGAEFGAEIGYYYGVIESYMEYFKTHECTEKIAKTIEGLEKSLTSFPRKNVDDVDIIAVMNEIRCNFKKLCAQLKINLSYPELDELSF